MKPERHEAQSESFPQVGEGMFANLLQIQLIPLAYKLDHPNVKLNMADREKRNEVMSEWSDRYAEAFREYVDDNPKEQIDISNEEALLEFLMKVKEYTTVH